MDLYGADLGVLVRCTRIYNIISHITCLYMYLIGALKPHIDCTDPAPSTNNIHIFCVVYVCLLFIFRLCACCLFVCDECRVCSIPARILYVCSARSVHHTNNTENRSTQMHSCSCLSVCRVLSTRKRFKIYNT